MARSGSKRSRVLAVILVLACVLFALSLPLARRYVAHHAIIVDMPLSRSGQPSEVSVTNNRDTIRMSRILCSTQYLQREYARTKDLNVFALIQYRQGVLSTQDIWDEWWRLRGMSPLEYYRGRDLYDPTTTQVSKEPNKGTDREPNKGTGLE